MITDIQTKSLKPRDKSYMVRDDRGLYLRVDPSGHKYWILRYWEHKKEYQISLGPYPDVSLKDARTRRDEIQSARAKGISPRAEHAPAPMTFEEVVQDWWGTRMTARSPGYQKAIRLRLQKYILPALGSRNIQDITAGEVLRFLRQVENLGYLETAQRLKTLAGQVFRYAIAAGLLNTDPTVALKGALQAAIPGHFATMKQEDDIQTLAAVIRAYPFPVVRGVLLLQLLTATRPGEVRAAEWAEFTQDTWTIPAEKMKARRPHTVPLVRQAQQLLDELRPLTGANRWLFPSARDATRPISDGAARLALRGMGFNREQITPHGFRAMFSTWTNERNYPPDVIEACLAHQDRNTIRAAYNRAEYLDQRRELLQKWADWLEGFALA